MFFKDIIGQDNAVNNLRQAINNNRLPHALLIQAQDGAGGLRLAHAAAQYIVCQHKHDGEPCGTCPECIQLAKCAHPDVHWVYPVVNKGGSGKDASISEDYIADWREHYLSNPDLSLKEWIRKIAKDKEKGENKQSKIFVSEAANLIRTLSTKPYESDYRIVILWMPEKMGEDTANKLLKIVEEPYEKTYFLMVSCEPESIIGTIQSRVQRLNLLPPTPEQLQKQAISDAEDMMTDEEEKFCFDNFCAMMRLSYSRKLFDMKAWAEDMATIGRERQKNYLQYNQRMIRENYIMNLRTPELNNMNEQESAFSSKFSRFVNANNVEGIMQELSQAEIDITLNGSAKMIFFDLSLKLIMLLKNGNPA